MGGGSPPRKGKKDSRFHEGKTLSKTLTKSSFGRFLRVIQERRLENRKFSKPIVITIGVECAGKSSLLEFLMKCEMFPRNNKPCTLGPIRFILVNAEEESVTITFRGVTTRLARKEEILGHLQAVMDTLVDEQGNPVIIEDELIVELHSPDVPDFEMVDLPGIREYPDDLREKTKSLAQKYMRSADTLVVCVVPATNPRLTSSQALGMVIDEGVQANTILVLTMADLVQSPYVEQYLLSRLTGLSGEISELGLAGCVAVVNRSLTQDVTLAEAEVEEAKYFDNLIAHVLAEGLQDTYPLDQVVACVTSGRLMGMLDRLFHRFICQNWKSRALEDLGRQAQGAAGELLMVGTPPLEVDAFHLARVVLQQAHIDAIRSFDVPTLCAKLVQFHDGMEYHPASQRYEVDNMLYRALKAVDTYTTPGSMPGTCAVSSSPFIQDVQVALRDGLLGRFKDDLSVDMAQLLPIRFQDLVAMVRNKLVREIEAEAAMMNQLLRENATKQLLKAAPGVMPEGGASGLMATVAEKSIKLVSRHVAMVAQRLFVDEEASPIFAAFVADPLRYLVESGEWQGRRRAAEEKVESIRACVGIISDIDNLMEESK
eukprot:jgi/Mesvir1/19625/Mv09915-RA.1